MSTSLKNSQESQLFILEEFAFWFCIEFSIALLLFLAYAVFGFFAPQLVLATGAAFFVLLFFTGFFLNRKRKGEKMERRDWFAVGLIVGFSLLTILFHHDLPLGRDDMGYLTAAVNLSTSHSLAFTDVITRPYHPYISLGGDLFTSQFLFAYYAYLAVWYLFLGISGFAVANGFLLLLLFLSVYIVARRAHSPLSGMFSILILGTSYTYLWFPRRTLSENLLGALLWAGIVCSVSGVATKRFFRVAAGLLPVSLILLLRGEGIMYVAMYCVVLLGIAIFFRRRRVSLTLMRTLPLFLLPLGSFFLFQEHIERYGRYIVDYTARNATSLADLLFSGTTMVWMGFTVLLTVVLSRCLSRSIQRRFNKEWSWFSIALVLLVVGLAFFLPLYREHLIWKEIIDWREYKVLFVVENFWYYRILPFAVIGILGLMAYRRFPLVVIPILLLLPGFVFVIDPHIAVDQPWFLRRYHGVIIPLFMMLSGMSLAFLARTARQKILICAMIILLNFSVSWTLLFHVDNRGIQPELQSLAREFQPNDLLIMQPGWRWQQWGYALHYVYGVRALPNWDGFTKDELVKLVEDAQTVYVLSSTKRSIHPLYDDADLIFVRDWPLRYETLQPTTHITNYVDTEKRNLSFDKIRRNQKGTPPRAFIEKREVYSLYRVKKEAAIHEDVIETIGPF